jgi:hypothetical protein
MPVLKNQRCKKAYEQLADLVLASLERLEQQVVRIPQDRRSRERIDAPAMSAPACGSLAQDAKTIKCWCGRSSRCDSPICQMPEIWVDNPDENAPPRS